jgi:hypothetical protein
MAWWNPCDWGNTEDEDEKAYNDGADWAETLIAVDADVVPTQVEVMADQLSSNPYEFYDGFRDVWNSQPELEEQRGLFSRLGSWFSW